MNDAIVQRLCHQLASCEESTRSQALRGISKLFKQTKQQAEDLKLLKICKALYYMLWMTDKPINVRSMAVSVVELQEKFPQRKNRFSFFLCLFRSLSMEWPSLDKNRLDKMLLFVRITVASLLELLNDGKWDEQELLEFSNIVLDSQGIFHTRSPGLAFQFIQAFMDEMEGNMKELQERNLWNKIDEMDYLLLMVPFLRLVMILENEQLVDTLSVHLFNRAGSLEGVPPQAVSRAMGLLAENRKLKKARRKMLKKAVKTIGDVKSLDTQLEKKIEEIVKGILSDPQSNETHEQMDCDEEDLHTNVTNSDMLEKEEENMMDVDVSDSNLVPDLVDVADELDEDYIDYSGIPLMNGLPYTMLRHLQQIETLENLRRKLIASGHHKNKILTKLNGPRFRMQRFLLTLHSLRRLKQTWRFKSASHLNSIKDITETATKKGSSRKHAIDVSKALHNIKHAKPGKSIVRKRNRKSTEKKSVVFNLKDNQIATIPKKKRSTLTMPMWY